MRPKITPLRNNLRKTVIEPYCLVNVCQVTFYPGDRLLNHQIKGCTDINQYCSNGLASSSCLYPHDINSHQSCLIGAVLHQYIKIRITNLVLCQILIWLQVYSLSCLACILSCSDDLLYHPLGNLFCMIERFIIWCKWLSIWSAASFLQKVSSPSILLLKKFSFDRFF